MGTTQFIILNLINLFPDFSFKDEFAKVIFYSIWEVEVLKDFIFINIILER